MPDNRNAKSKKRRKTRQNKKNNKANDVTCSNIAENDLNKCAEVDSEVSNSSVAPTEAAVCGSVQVDIAEECDVEDDRDVAFENDLSMGEGVTLIKSSSTEGNLNFSKSAPIFEFNEQAYNVESPERSLKKPPKKKLIHVPKSKSLDNDEDSQLNIVEITEHYDGDSNDEKSEKSILVESNAIVYEAESDVEWEVADTLREKIFVDRPTVKGTLSIETISLDQAECEHTQSLSPDEELSLRQYLQSLHLATSSDVCPLESTTKECETDIYVNNGDKSSSKGRKKATVEEITRHATLKPRFLEVIDEEGSSESSLTTRRHSYLNEDKNEFDDLDDDVFIDNKQIIKQHNDNFPKSFANNKNTTQKSNVHQECLLLDTKFIEPAIKEGCGDWKLETLERIDGAEVVYLDDSSSSTSDIYDIIEEGDEMQEFDENVQIRTPIIEIEAAETLKPNFRDMGRSLKTPPPSPQVSFDIDDSIEPFERHMYQPETKTSVSVTQNNESKTGVSQSEPNKVIYHKIELHISENDDSDGIVLNENSNIRNKFDPTVLVDVNPNSNLLAGDKQSDSFSNSFEEKSVSIPIVNQKYDSVVQVDEKIMPTVLIGNKYNNTAIPVREKIIPVTLISHKSDSTVTSTDEKTNSTVRIQGTPSLTALDHEKSNLISTPVKDKSVSSVLVNSKSSSNQKSNSTISVRKQINSPVLVHDKSNKNIEEECQMTSTPVVEKNIPITLVNQQSYLNVKVDEKITPTVMVNEKLKTSSLPAEDEIIPSTLVNQKSSSNELVDEKSIPIPIVVGTASLPALKKNISNVLVDHNSTSNVQFDEIIIPPTLIDEKCKTALIPVQENIIPITLVNKTYSSDIPVDEKCIAAAGVDIKLNKTSLSGQENIIPITLVNKTYSSDIPVDEKFIAAAGGDIKLNKTSLSGQEKIIPITLYNQTSNSNIQINETSIPPAVVNEKCKTALGSVQEKIIPITLSNQTSSSNEQIREKVISTEFVEKKRRASLKLAEEKTIAITPIKYKSDSSVLDVQKTIPITLINHKSDSSVPIELIPTVFFPDKTNSTVVIDENHISTSTSYNERLINHKCFSTVHPDETIIPVELDRGNSDINILHKENINLSSKAVQQNSDLIALDNNKSDLTVLGDKIIEPTVQNIPNATELIVEKSNAAISSDSNINSLKDELNAALLNLMQQVTEDSNISKCTSNNTTYSRQDSSSSIASSQSQCTARYNPNTSSLTDIATMLHDDLSNNDLQINIDGSKSHVEEVIECITESASKEPMPDPVLKQPSKLKEMCVVKIAELPYGKSILEELANLSESLKEVITVNNDILKHTNTYAEILDKMSLQSKQTSNYVVLSSKDYRPLNYAKIPPPPVAPRNSSLKITTEDVLKNKSKAMSSPFALKTDNSSRFHDASDVNCRNVEHNTYRTDTTYLESRTSDVTKSTNAGTSPFKSQTGNRLLAIIQDPSINANLTQFRTSSIPTLDHKLYSSMNSLNLKTENFCNSNTGIKKSIENDIQKIYTYPETPIPPPRTRKYKTTNYESDDSSEMTDSSHYSRSERKHFYSSLGNINEDFESSTSASHLQYLYKKSSRAKDHIDHFSDSTYSHIESNIPRRRLSLPRDICDQQMEYILSKEKQIEDEIKRLETSRDRTKGPRAPLLSEKQYREENMFDTNKFHISRRGDFAVFSESGSTLNERPRPAHLTSSQEELFREKMYTEYMNKFAERAERKQHKIIKITSAPLTADYRHNSLSLPILNHSLNQEIKNTCNKIEEEFISKAKQRWDKIGFKDPETDDEREQDQSQNKPLVVEHKIKVIEEGKEKDMTRLPNHLREFVQFTAGDKDPAASSPAIWSPGSVGRAASPPPGTPPAPPPPPVWAPPASPPAPRKPFRPVAFSSPTLQRRSQVAPAEQTTAELVTPSPTNGISPVTASPASAPPSSPGAAPAPPRLPSSQSAPAAGLQALAGSRLPRAQNPTITLLQKAREGQIPRGPSYIQEAPQRGRNDARNSPPRYEPVYTLKKEYQSEPESEGERPRKMAELGPKKVEGIGPITKEGMPVALRSEVKDPSRWYKKMYDTIHKSKNDGQPSIHRTAPNRSQYAYFDPRSGYLSEPEPGTGGNWSDAYDSDVTTGMANRRRRTASVQDGANTNGESSNYLPNNKYSTLASARASQEVYKNQPGKIEDYMPGRSSVVDKEAKQQLSSTTSLHQTPTKEKKELTSAILSKSNMARALKESGYESDSTLVFRRREADEAPLSPLERRQAYRSLQAGGEPPLHGFRSPAPERPREPDWTPEPPPKGTSQNGRSTVESPRRYVESDVNIHYRCPVRQEPRPLVPEHELARRQAEHMRRVYQEERRRKYLQELQDMQSRRHTDNFTPSQKTAVLLNRYDDLDGVAQHKPKVMARALFPFTSQSTRELGFRKGDLITVRRQVDANWYEGELNGKVGLFPYNYIEITKGEAQAAPKKSAVEGRARAKFDFTAQTTLELPLKRGELVVLTRRIDQNWWEGRLGSKTGIFPDSYVQVLAEPSPNRGEVVGTVRTDKPVASPASHGLLNGSAKHSMGAHSYTPQLNSAALSNAPPATQPLPNQYVANYHAKPAHATLTPSERGYGPPSTPGIDLNNSQPLYIDTNAEAVPYRAMYKYRPQNPDELELMEGDTVYVLEKCDDGWYVGSSQRTGKFGTFPGNYVERI